MQDHEKRCRICGDVKPLAQFWPDKRKADGRRSECAVCSGRVRREGSPWRKRPKYVEDDHGYVTPCWQWQWAKTLKGYGTITLPRSEGQRWMPAHRYFYEQAKGPIPDGYQIDHLCRNHSCVNPEHLEAVTQAENVRRGANTRLTHLQVSKIRASDRPAAEIARQFGISASHVYTIRAGLAWAPDARTNRLEMAA